MELRRYLAIIQRAWWLVLGLPALVLLLSLPTFRPDPPRYRVTAKVAVSHAAIGGNEILPDMNVYNSWQSSQFIVDDLPAILRSRAFAEEVSAWVAQNRGLTIDPAAVQGTYDLESQHRVFSIIVNADQPERATAIAAGSVAVLAEQGLRFWGRAPSGGLDVAALDVPESATALSRWPQPVTKLALRLLLALLAGLGLAFVRHYLDQTVRERGDLDSLGLPVLASIPKETK
ncbi:MAG TPA: Wzz/FepE/Etk N-terminal domain-containing protein [Herpetosiphonaceae bacterium]|nr:Wzz/FepE/Etk N-terminal domain-containing protein [Herpetosiphonaceae bacterium]